MRKTTGIFIAVVAVAAVYTGASWYVGKQARITIEQTVAEANERMSRSFVPQTSGAGAALAIAEYRRGIFASDIVYSLRVQDEPGTEYLLSDHLQHGPFPAGAVLAGNLIPMMALSQARLLPSATTQAWFDSRGGESPVTARTEVRFGGKAVSEWVFEPLAVAQEGEVLKFSGGTVRATLENDFADSKVTGEFDQLDYSMGPGTERVIIDDVSFEYATISSGNEIRMQSTTRVAGLSIDLLEAGSLAFHDATMAVSSERQGDLGGGAVRYDFGKVSSNSINLGSMSLGVSGRDFSMPALSELAAVYDELNARHGPQEQWQLSPVEAALLQDKLIGLLAGNPTLALEPVAWRNDKGESQAALVVSLTQPAQPEASLSLDALLQQAIRTLDLELHIEKPMLMHALEQIQGEAEDPQATAMAAALYDEYVGRLQAAGLATISDGASSTKISYREGRVDANGRQMSLPEFIQRALLVFLM
ncbi:YdgA family protein [Pusillimonas sp.]|uniref:YdgA family protein n=1 Tax=Pusillimonas sp. TaxID=3040095 RepID=UPI0037C6BE55